MARKAKKRMHKMPPLSFADKLIYWIIFLLLAAAYLLLMFGPIHLRQKIAFSDEMVLAAEDHVSTIQRKGGENHGTESEKTDA